MLGVDSATTNDKGGGNRATGEQRHGSTGYGLADGLTFLWIFRVMGFTQVACHSHKSSAPLIAKVAATDGSASKAKNRSKGCSTGSTGHQSTDDSTGDGADRHAGSSANGGCV